MIRLLFPGVTVSWLCTALAQTLPAAPLGTAFTYQGQLQQSGRAANGWYDFQFGLWDAGTNGALVGTAEAISGVWVSNGLFSATLDFGSIFNGTALWLEIAVRTNGGASGFTTLAPRQPLTAAPAASYSSSAGAAATAQYATAAAQAGSLTSPLAGDKLAGFYPSVVVLDNLSNTFSGAFYGQTYGNVYGSLYGNLFGTICGDGAGIVNLNAGNLAAGTLPDARLSTNVARLEASQLFTGSNTFAGPLIATNAANQITGAFSGTGAGLTNLNSANLVTPTSAAPAGDTVDFSIRESTKSAAGNIAFTAISNWSTTNYNWSIVHVLANGADCAVTFGSGWRTSGGPCIVTNGTMKDFLFTCQINVFTNAQWISAY